MNFACVIRVEIRRFGRIVRNSRALFFSKLRVFNGAV